MTIYKSLFLSKFFVRVTARSKTMIFKPTTPLDGEKCSLWISNFWSKSFLPFDLYREKSCKNGEISTRSRASIASKNCFVFFRNYCIPQCELFGRAHFESLLHAKETFQTRQHIMSHHFQLPYESVFASPQILPSLCAKL